MDALDMNKVLAVTERTYGEWLEAIAATNDRDLWFEYANDIRLSSVLKEGDRLSLHKALARRLGYTVRVLLQDLAREFDGAAPTEKDDRQLARDILNDDLVFAQDGFYLWRECGIWAPAHDREIRQRIGDVLQAGGLPVANRKVGDVLSVLKDEAYSLQARFDEPQANRVNCTNGTLELDGATWTLREHRREDYLTQQLPVAYDPNAKYPRFDQFLMEVFEGDDDAADKATLIKEMLGYTLLQSCRFEKFIMLIGSGANGKSVLLRVLQGLLGSSAYCAVMPADLANETSRYALKGKLANIVPELPAGSILADDVMKTFTSGEPCTAKKLYADKITFAPFATTWIGTNNLPHSRDLSRGMFRRAIVVRFGRSFEGRADTLLIDKLLEELPGILVSACRAFSGVVARGGFTIPASSETEVKAWRMACDQVAEWFEEGVAVDLLAEPVRFAEAFENYRVWTGNMGIKAPVSGKEFSTRLQALGVTADRAYFGKKQERAFFGIKLL